MVVRLADLGHLGEPVGSPGGQGTVYAIGRNEPYVVKLYHEPSNEAERLEALISWRSRLPVAEADLLDSMTAWPRERVVNDTDETVGILLPRAPGRFSYRTKDDTSHLRELQHLTLPERSIEAGVPSPTLRQRLSICIALNTVFELFQNHHIVYGDFSGKNILWTIRPAPSVYLLDCDSCLIGRVGSRVTASTMDWRDPRREPTPDEQSDRYCMGLAFLRIFYAAPYRLDENDRNIVVPDNWPSLPALEGLLGRSLRPSGDRPDPSEWLTELRAARRTVPALRVTGTSKLESQPNEDPGHAETTRSSRPLLLATVVLIVVVIIVSLLSRRSHPRSVTGTNAPPFTLGGFGSVTTVTISTSSTTLTTPTVPPAVLPTLATTAPTTMPTTVPPTVPPTVPQLIAMRSTFSVNAGEDLPGLDTGISIGASNLLTISASGSATYGYDPGQCGGNGYPSTDPLGNRSLGGAPCAPKYDQGAVVPSAPIGALLICIEPSATDCSGNWQMNGYLVEMPGGKSGELFLLYNDVHGVYIDNTGTYTVVVTVRK